jgi:hypothetical protein
MLISHFAYCESIKSSRAVERGITSSVHKPSSENIHEITSSCIDASGIVLIAKVMHFKT